MAPKLEDTTADSVPSESAKRRGGKRTARACDECRLRKSKCDGLQPCEACRNTERYCTFNLSASRSTGPGTRIRILEDRLRRARAYLNEAQRRTPSMSHINFDSLLGPIDEQHAARKSTRHKPDDDGDGDDSADTDPEDDDEQEKLDSMMSSYGQMTIDSSDGTARDFYGAASGLAFIQKTQSLFQNSRVEDSQHNDGNSKRSAIVQLFDAPLPSKQALSVDVSISQLLPPRHVAFTMLRIVFTKVYPLFNFLNEQSCRKSVDRLYDLDPIEYKEGDHDFVRLFYAIVGLGYMFSREEHEKYGCREAVTQGMRHFIAARSMTDVTGLRTLNCLQTVICLVLFLVSTARIASAHAYMGAACAAAMRQGLHYRSTHDASLSQEARDVRRRVFWAVISLDMYINGILGLPNFIDLSAVNPAIDMTIDLALQDVKKERDVPNRDNIILAAAAKHIEILRIIRRANNALFPKPPDTPDVASGKGVIRVSISKLNKVETEFRQWAKSISEVLPVNDEDEQLMSVRYELEMIYHCGHVILYRAFLHYLTKDDGEGRPGSRQLEYAKKCVKVSSKAISTSVALQKRGLLCPASWPALYTVFLSTVCLIFALATRKTDENESKDREEIESGIRLLASTACTTDTGSVRCLEILRALIECVSYSVSIDVDQICSETVPCCTADFSHTDPLGRQKEHLYVAKGQLDQSISSASSSPAWMTPFRQSSDPNNASTINIDQNQSMSSQDLAQAFGTSHPDFQFAQQYLSPSIGDDMMEVPYMQDFAWPSQGFPNSSNGEDHSSRAASEAQHGGLTAEDITAFMQISPGDLPFRKSTE